MAAEKADRNVKIEKVKVDLDPDSARFINSYVAKEYMNEVQGVYA